MKRRIGPLDAGKARENLYVVPEHADNAIGIRVQNPNRRQQRTLGSETGSAATVTIAATTMTDAR